MKKIICSLLVFLIALFVSTSVFAQNRLVIPLSEPGNAGNLKLNIIRGSIDVTGYSGNEVIISYDGEKKDDDSPKVTKDGLRRLTNTSVGFEVEEEDNSIEIGGVSPMRDIAFDISVPRHFSLELSAVNAGDITVKDVNGTIEISNVNGGVELQEVSGSAVINTVNGAITATFKNVAENKPMAFSTLNGDIDVTLPAGVQASPKIKSEWGEVYTDFNMNIDQSKNGKVQTSSDSDTYKVSVNNWIYGTLNGGGPEYLFRSLRGDIYIRKK